MRVVLLMATTWDMEEVRDLVIPLVILRDAIHKAAYIQPTAVMLPLSLVPGMETVFGLPIVRGDRTALLYEPPRRV